MPTINPFNSVHELAIKHKLVLPKPRHWWLLTEPITGEVNAVHTIRGLAVATNGILYAILNQQGKIDFGHVQWFVEDVDEIRERDLSKPSRRQRIHIEYQ